MLLIDKDLIQNNFKTETFNKVVKIILKDLDKKHIKNEKNNEGKG